MGERGPALGTYASPPPRQIDLDPKSARTVVHEVYARRRAPSGENDGQGAIPPRLRVSPYDEDEELDRKSGLLPRGTVAQRRRSAIEGGSGRYRHQHYDSDSSTDSEPEYVRPRRNTSHNHHSHRRHESPRRLPAPLPAPRSHSSTSSSRRRERHSNEIVRYDPGLDLDLNKEMDIHRSKHDARPPSSSSSEFDPEEERKARNHALIYTGLATLTTVTCANGIYQHTKGFQARRKAYKESKSAHTGSTREEEEERRKARKKKIAMDLFALGVVGIGLNNVRVGWGRREEMRKAHHEAEKKAWERNVRKRREHEDKYSVEEA